VLSQIGVLANEYQSLAEKKHICYILDISENGERDWNDRDKISKVLTNLLSNSFKFTPEFGTITCRVRKFNRSSNPEQSLLRILVADTGMGIPPGEQEKVFDRFYRITGNQHADAGGTGIGLSLTRELVHLLHGDIRMKSIVETGTVFMVTLPLGIGHLNQDEFILKREKEPSSRALVINKDSSKSIFSDEGSSTKISILIVEDNEEVRSFIKDSLQSNYEILEADDGLRGLDLARNAIPDVIVSDIMMPGMDGRKLCEKLKNDERTSHIPVILLTARASTHDKIEGLECGADDYIFKPFSLEEIVARIRNLLKQREILRKKYSTYIGLDWSEITVNSPDEQFLKKATGIIAKNLHNFTFDVGALQEKMAMGDSTLFRKLKALTGESPSSLIRIMRLKKAASMLERNEQTITDVLMSVGFSNPSYFSRCFKAYYGQTPKDYQKSCKQSG
jgi:DNA-binding response OmpR family regulator